VSEGLLLSENKLFFNEMMMRSALF
jgi:hypothetical protein